ncbi:hypothetical protein [Roseomonas sp. USHLN139]|uniref:hypothetical protein n=1 Tax=Roseomonas sp. USHLN139 TaxID=3081298 RepID=UPI003B01F51C
MSQHPLVQRAEEAGVSLFLEGDRVRWQASQPPQADLLAALKASQAEIAQALAAADRIAAEAPPAGEVGSTAAMARDVASPLIYPLPFVPFRSWPPGSLEARAVRYLAEPGAEIIPGQDGWLYVTLLDGRYLYLAPAVLRRIGWSADTA